MPTHTLQLHYYQSVCSHQNREPGWLPETSSFQPQPAMMIAPAPLNWKFSQIFGQPNPNDQFQDDDQTTTVSFEKRSDYLAVGDRGGRIIIFDRDDNKEDNGSNQQYYRKDLEQLDFAPSRHPRTFQYKTEFQSHEPEFDYSRSVEIEERIKKVRWCMTHHGLLLILSTNDKTIKLWKVKEHKATKVKEMAHLPCSENMLLAESSFISGEGTQPAANGYHLEWIEKMTQNLLLPQDINVNVGSCEKYVGNSRA